jgi:hypothetical protein
MLGYTRDNTLLYDLSMPGKLKGSAARVNMDTFVMPGHELIQEDWQSNFDDYAVRLQELVDDRALPPCYYDHPVVLAHGGAAPVFPCAFFGTGLRILYQTP